MQPVSAVTMAAPMDRWRHPIGIRTSVALVGVDVATPTSVTTTYVHTGGRTARMRMATLTASVGVSFARGADGSVAANF